MKRGFTHESTYNESKEWYTPLRIFDALGLEFDLDPCSPGMAIVSWIPATQHFTIKNNGLSKEWRGNVWLNPPYGNDTPKWFRRLALHGTGIGLVFSRTDVGWFHEYIPMADAICFIKGRVQFVPAAKDDIDYPYLYSQGKYNPKGGCGAGSMLVAFGKDNADALFRCGLGLTLPVGRNTEKFRTGERFVGDKNGAQHSTACPNENPPRLSESRQGILFGSNR